MSDKAGQMEILREIFVEDFEAEDAGKRGASTLFEVTSVEGAEIPEGISVLINFDDIGKVRFVGPATPPRMPGCSKQIDDERFMGNLNVFVMKKKKVLKHVHMSFDGKTFAEKKDIYSLKEILMAY